MRLFFGHSNVAAQLTGQQPGYSKSRAQRSAKTSGVLRTLRERVLMEQRSKSRSFTHKHTQQTPPLYLDLAQGYFLINAWGNPIAHTHRPLACPSCAQAPGRQQIK